MLAQAFLMLCSLLPMFAYGGKNPVAVVLLALVGNFLLCYNIPLTELLVDTLLPLAAVACLLFLHRGYMSGEKQLPMRYAFAMLFWVLNIKNAGILLVAAGVLLLAMDRKKKEQSLKPVAFLLLVLMAGYLLWDRHCDYVFDNTGIRQHEISLRYFKQILGEKSLTDACRIVWMLAKEMVLRRELVLILAAVLLLWGLTRFRAPEKRKQYNGLLIFLLLSFVVYGISLMGMYVCSMSLEGALELQSADRYIRIWEILAWYLLAAYGASVLSTGTHRQWVGILLAVAMGACTLGYYGGVLCFFQFPSYDAEERMRNEAPIAEYGVAPGMGYLICAEQDVVWTAAFQWGYHLNTNQFAQIHVTEMAQLTVAEQYDYVVILDQGNPVIEAWVEGNYPEQAGKQVIQCFR